MADFVETMAYRADGGVPWHGLGVPVNNDMTPEEMLVAAGLDWEVHKRSLYFPLKTDDGKTKLRIAPGEYGLIRSTDEAYLDTVGENFKVPQNRDIAEFFTRFVKAGDMQMETMGSIKNGKFIWALARINESFDLGKGDRTNGYMLLSQPHRYGFSMTAILTAVRVVCWNTINAAGGITADTGDDVVVPNASFRMTHAHEFDDEMKSKIEQVLGFAGANMKAFGHTAEMLSQIRAKNDAVTDYFHQVLQLEKEELAEGEDAEDHESRNVKRFREALTHAPGQDLFRDTWWNSFNAVTHTVDHVMGRSLDSRLHNAWYGTGKTLKQRALKLAIDFAKGP